MMKNNKKFLDSLSSRKKKEIKPKKNTPQWLYPNSQEREYHRILKRLTRQIRDSIKENLLPQIPLMLGEVEVKTPRNDDFFNKIPRNDDFFNKTIRIDDFLEELNSIILFIRKTISPE